MSKNIQWREASKKYYLRATIAGKQYYQSLQTDNKEEATRLARVKIKAIESGHIADLTKTRVKRNVATIGEIVDVYLATVARVGKPRPSTARSNAWALLRLVTQTLGLADADAARKASSIILTEKLAIDFASLRIPVTGSEQDKARARVSVSSMLRQARAVFKRSWRGAYRQAELVIPDTVRDFVEEYVCDNPVADWKEPPPEEIGPILEAGPRLRETHPDLWPVWLLAFHVAMRAGEIARAQWDWFEARDGRMWFRDKRRPEQGYVPKGGHEGWTPLSDSVWNQLKQLRREGDPFVIPGGTPTARRHLVNRDFAAWMRSLGWTRRHKAHELRAWRGNIWRHQVNESAMKDWLRHTSVSVGVKHYSDSYNPAALPAG